METDCCLRRLPQIGPLHSAFIHQNRLVENFRVERKTISKASREVSGGGKNEFI